MATVPPGVLQEVLHRVVKLAAPEQIIMFGSAARGTMGPHSDVDLLVIKRGAYDRNVICGAIYEALIGVGQAVDIILVTPEEVERHREVSYQVIKPALDEGIVVYAA